MDNQRRAAVVVCPENEALAAYMWSKKQELAESPKGISENVDATLSKAYSNVCNSSVPIRTLKDLSQIKGVGKWILRLMQGFFETSSGSSEPEGSTKEGNKHKGIKRYVPQKNSVSYALLIALFRGTGNGNEFMRKQELIDAAEASGLTRVPIAPDRGKGKPGKFGSSPKDWYSGWNCMKTLITRGLVVKSSCPAKYMLTQEGQEVARKCLMRSGLADPVEGLANAESFLDEVEHCMPAVDSAQTGTDEEVASTSTFLSSRKKSVDVPVESLERFMKMGYSKEQVLAAFAEVLGTSQKKEISSLWPAVLCCLREGLVYGLHSESRPLGEGCLATLDVYTNPNGERDVQSERIMMDYSHDGGLVPVFNASTTAPNSFTLRPCSAFVCVRKQYFPLQSSYFFGSLIVSVGSQILQLYLLHLLSGNPLRY